MSQRDKERTESEIYPSHGNTRLRPSVIILCVGLIALPFVYLASAGPLVLIWNNLGWHSSSFLEGYLPPAEAVYESSEHYQRYIDWWLERLN
ncbi:MAG: hypothetical protein HKN23_05575 [Verrucomicrobiales bacterium]|nr:hypothetical protein [Verrucomicrobiales bacterium]